MKKVLFTPLLIIMLLVSSCAESTNTVVVENEKNNSEIVTNNLGTENKTVFVKATLDDVVNSSYDLVYNYYNMLGRIDTSQVFEGILDIEDNKKINLLGNTHLLANFGLINTYKKDKVVTKNELALFLYNILVDTNKLPVTSKDIQSELLGYTEAGEPVKSGVVKIAVDTIDSIGVMSFSSDSDGLNTMFVSDLDGAIVKFKNYMYNSAIDNKYKAIDSDVETKYMVNKTDLSYESKKEIEVKLNDRVISDYLNGTSIATFKKPISLLELNYNLKEFPKIDPDKPFESRNYFINIAECLYDYELLTQIYANTNIVTVCDYPFDSSSITEDATKGTIKLKSYLFNILGVKKKATLITKDTSSYKSTCFIIADGKVIDSGNVGSDNTLSFAKSSLEQSDYIGLVIERGTLIDSKTSDKSLVLVLVPTKDIKY